MSAFEYYHNWHLSNRDIAQTLEHYIMRGYAPGGFTTAVLAGDLFGAVAKADRWNKQNIPKIVTEVLASCPSVALGSYDAVEAWLNDEDSRRSKYATWKMLQGPVKLQDEVPF
jgi:hypothetical protein